MKAIRQEDLLIYRSLSGVAWNPAGTLAAFVVSRANAKQTGYDSCLYLYENGAVRQLTALGKEARFVWLDDDRLLFAADRTEEEKERRKKGEEFSAWYCLDVAHGGEALPFMTLPFAAGQLKVLDTAHFAVTADIDARIPDYADMTDEARAQVAKDREGDKDYEVFDENPWWANGGGVTDKRRTALYLVSVENVVEWQRVTEPTESVEALAVLGDEVIYNAKAFDTLADFRGCRVQAVNRYTGEKRLILADDALTTEELIVVGSGLWLLGSAGERYGLNENSWIYRLDPADGALSVLRREEGSLYGIVGTDVRHGGGTVRAAKGGSLYCVTTRGGSAPIIRVDADGTAADILSDEGSADCFAVSEKHDTALVIGLYDMRLQELYAVDLATGRKKRVTHFNDDALKGRYVARPLRLTVSSAGLEIEGWVLPPKDFDPQKTYPAVLDIHGGPKTAYGPVFMHEMQLWAGMGCFVFYCNPKGSDGRDNAFADIRGHYGDTDYQNLMDFTDAVLAACPQIDPARVCVTGGSYGGFMTNWIIGHTGRFCCAASQRSIANWVSMYGISDIGIEFVRDQAGARIDTDVETLWRQSPLKYAAAVTTPTLFIHSDEDYRCPLAEGLQMLTALLEHGVPARLCLFHGENHELSRSGQPKHRLRRLKEITDWFVTYAHIGN